MVVNREQYKILNNCKTLCYRIRSMEQEYLIVHDTCGIYDIFLIDNDNNMKRLPHHLLYFDKNNKVFIESYNYRNKKDEVQMTVFGELIS